MPDVSIVLSVYNGNETLADALETALGQTFDNFELIAIDDASSDDSLSTLNVYAKRDQRVRILRNTQNRGLSNSLNRAIAAAQGSIIMRMDQDDISLSTRLEKQYSVMTKHPEVGLVSCYVDPLYSSDADGPIRAGVAKFEARRREMMKHSSDIVDKLLIHNVFHHGEVLFRKQIWKLVGGYRPECAMSEDYDLWLRFIGHSQFYILPDILYIRRFGNTNTSHAYEKLQIFTAELARKCYHLRKHGEDDREYVRDQFIGFVSEQGLLDRFMPHLSGN